MKVKLALTETNNNTIHDTELELKVFPQPDISVKKRAFILGHPQGKAARLAKELGMETIFSGKINATDAIIIDDFSIYKNNVENITKAVKDGAVALYLELPVGKYNVAETDITVTECGMGKRHFVSRNTGHLLVDGFGVDDFKFWYDADFDYPTPLLSTTFEAPGWEKILTSGNGDWRADWKPVCAAAEFKDGKGVWRICQVHLSGRTIKNPVADIFSKRLLGIVEH